VLALLDPFRSLQNCSLANNQANGNLQIFDREGIAACEALGSALVSYCDAGDIYCDSSHDNRRDLSVHGEYFEKYHDEVLDFITSRYEGDSGSSNETITRTPVEEGAAVGLSVEMKYLLLGLASSSSGSRFDPEVEAHVSRPCSAEISGLLRYMKAQQLEYIALIGNVMLMRPNCAAVVQPTV
jgi:hypothetical protein